MPRLDLSGSIWTNTPGIMLHPCGWYSRSIDGLRLSRQRIVVQRKPEKSGLYISSVFSYFMACPFVLCSCFISKSSITSLLMSEASPDSSSARTVDDRCLPMLSAPRYLAYHLGVDKVPPIPKLGAVCVYHCISAIKNKFFT